MRENGFISNDEFSILLEEVLANKIKRVKRINDIYTMFQNNILTKNEFDNYKNSLFEIVEDSCSLTIEGNDDSIVKKDVDVTSAESQRLKEAKSIISISSIIACLIGLFPLPIADAPLLIITQFVMMKKLCGKYGREPGMGLLLIVASAFLGPLIFSSFAKLFPGLGSILGACIGGGFTYLVGNTTSKILENKEEFNWENIKKALSKENKNQKGG